MTVGDLIAELQAMLELKPSRVHFEVRDREDQCIDWAYDDDTAGTVSLLPAPTQEDDGDF